MVSGCHNLLEYGTDEGMVFTVALSCLAVMKHGGQVHIMSPGTLSGGELTFGICRMGLLRLSESPFGGLWKCHRALIRQITETTLLVAKCACCFIKHSSSAEK